VQGQAPGQQFQPGQSGQQFGQQPGQQSGQAAMALSRHLATGLLLENQEEIALAQFAKEHLKSDDAKKFADMLIKDHQDAVSKLQRIVPQQMTVFFRGAEEGGEAASDEQGQRRSTVGQPGQSGQIPPTAGAGGQYGQPGGQGAPDVMTAFQQKVAEECFTLTRKELSEHEGAEFDQCYVGSQIGSHIAMLAKLKAAQQFASPELQPIIQESQQVTEQHLDKAKELAKAWQQEQQRK
jgi:predicted outer membrane protein